jgi:TRAP-type C4-dicarboxylate transport system permease small subunit
MKIIGRIESIVGVMSKVICAVSCVALVFNMLVILYDVFGRFVLKHALIGSSEYVSVAETVLIFFALAYTQHYKGLVHITFFMRKFPKLSPVIIWTFGEWCGVAVTALLTYAAWIQTGVVHQTHMSTTSLLIPYYPFHVLMTIGLAAYTVTVLFDAVKGTVALFNTEVREDLIANWPT